MYYDGTNKYEFYKAIGNYRNFVKAKNYSRKYYESWKKEIYYDVYHNHFRNALKKVEQPKDEMKEAKAVDYLIHYCHYVRLIFSPSFLVVSASSSS